MPGSEQAFPTGLLIKEVRNVVRIDKVCTWGWTGKASPQKAMLEGSSKHKQEAGGEDRERALEAEHRAEAKGCGCEKLSGFGS